MKKLILLLLSVFSISGMGRASYQPELMVEIDTHKILIGDQVDLHFRFSQPDAGILRLPVFDKNLTDAIEVLSHELDSIKSGNSKMQYRYSLRLTSFTPGNHLIPQVPFLYGTDTFYSPETYLEVLPVEIDTTNAIRDIKAVEVPPVTMRDIFPWLFSLMLAAIVVGGIYLLRKRKTESNGIFDPKAPLEPAYVIALRELDRLRAEKLWQQNLVKEYYTQLTQIIRAYIELQFQLPALEKTTSEILHSFESKEYRNKINYAPLSELLNLADMVKFAKGDPSPDENIRLLDLAYKFISNTKDIAQSDLTSEETLKMQVTNSVKEFYHKLHNVKHLSHEQVADRLIEGATLVQFEYCISLIVITFTLQSGVYLIERNQKTGPYSWRYNLVTILLGWWGIPWGPIRSIRALRTNSNGGKLIK